MFRRLMFLNMILVAVLVFGVFRIVRDLRAFSATHRVDQIQPESDKTGPKPVDSTAAATKQDWPDIAVHDPFSFDRNDVTIVVTPPAPQQPKRPKPVLYGTILLGKESIAILGTADAAARSSRSVHTGEVFDGWTVGEILEKTITVKWDQVTESLIMNDPTAQVGRDYSKTGAAVTAATPVVIAPVATAAPATAPSATTPTMQPTTTVSPTGKKQTVIQTPFGPKTVEDPSQ